MYKVESDNGPASAESPILAEESPPLPYLHQENLLQQQCIMVRLTITPNILRTLEELQDKGQVPQAQNDASEPSLDQPAIGNPITHGQIIAISKTLRKIRKDVTNGNADNMVSYHLDDLLRGSKVYVEPPKPKAEPVCFTYLPLHHTVLLTWPRLLNIRHSWHAFAEKRKTETTSA